MLTSNRNDLMPKKRRVMRRLDHSQHELYIKMTTIEIQGSRVWISFLDMNDKSILVGLVVQSFSSSQIVIEMTKSGHTSSVHVLCTHHVHISRVNRHCRYEDCADTTIEVSCEVILICVVASKPCLNR